MFASLKKTDHLDITDVGKPNKSLEKQYNKQHCIHQDFSQHVYP